MTASFALVLALAAAPETPPQPPAPIAFVQWGFENGSPLQWDVDAEGVLHVRLLYDYERDSPNRAAGHWHFRIEGRPGADATVVLHNFENVWNGRPGVPVSKQSVCYVSPDAKKWTAVPAEFLAGNLLRVKVRLETGSVYLARLEPYRPSDLDRLLEELRGQRLVEIAEIGRTVEGRPLEIVRVGDPARPGALFRARSHAWEPGGNWVVQGLIRSLLADDPSARRCLQRCCVYVVPMANKDSVARGLTRFNSRGKDLNRDWDRPADPDLCPENAALEAWLGRLVREGRAPRLAIDLHNDESGLLHISRPAVPGLAQHLDRMKRLEELLRKHTWFTEGSTTAAFRNPGTIGEGLVERYGIDACVLELNCNWIAGLKQHPSAAAWEQLGRQFRDVLADYFPP